MVALEAILGRFIGIELLLDAGEKDASLGSGARILKPVEDRFQGGVGGVARFLALLQETLHVRRRRRH